MDTDLCKVALNDSAYRHAGLIVTDDLQINGGRIAPPRSEVFLGGVKIIGNRVGIRRFREATSNARVVDGTVAIKRGSNDILSINRSGNCISQICIVERRAIIVEKENNSIYAGYFGNSNRIIVLQTCNIRSINIPDKVHIAGL